MAFRYITIFCWILGFVLTLGGMVSIGLSVKYLYLDQIISYRTNTCLILGCNTTSFICWCGRIQCTCYQSWMQLQLNSTNVTRYIADGGGFFYYDAYMSSLCQGKLKDNQNTTTCYYQVPNIAGTLDIMAPDQSDSQNGIGLIFLFTFLTIFGMFLLCIYSCSLIDE